MCGNYGNISITSKLGDTLCILIFILWLKRANHAVLGKFQ